MLLYVAWIGFWQAMLEPRLWTETAQAPARKNPKRDRSAVGDGR
jgi:hypothetical protein